METFFHSNYDVVVVASGQVFFVLGLVAAWGARKRLPLHRALGMLAGFGLLYAVAEWGRVAIPSVSTLIPWTTAVGLWIVRLVALVAAFAGLLQFGIELLPPRLQARARAVRPTLFGGMVGMILAGAALLGDLGQALWLADAAARLCLALPAAIVCAVGLAVQGWSLRRQAGPAVEGWLRVAAVAAVLSGVALGLMAPPVGPWRGTEWALGTPAELWRGLSAALFVLGLGGALEILRRAQARIEPAAA